MESTTNVSSSAETDFENVRIPNEQQFFTGELDNSFTYYFQPEQDDSTDTGDTDDSDKYLAKRRKAIGKAIKKQNGAG